MSLRTDIETIATNIYPDYTFLFMSQINADAEVTDTLPDDIPIFVLDNTIPKDKRLSLSTNITSTNNIELYALKKRNDDDSDETINTYIEAMELVLDRMVINISYLNNIILAENEELSFRIEPKFNLYISGLCGSKLIMKVKERQVISCSPPEE